MPKRVFIIHGWGGNPEEGWFPWLRKELSDRHIRVAIPLMPDADHPKIELWISRLKEEVGHCDDDTFFVGHSLGCQVILRYLEHQLPAVKVGGAVFVAAFEHLAGESFKTSPDAQSALHEWVTEPIHWEAIRGRSKNFVAFFSDNDPWVDLANVDVFSRKLEARTHVFHDRGHFSGSQGTVELPEVRDALLKMMHI